jgi:release factor glutamine methyltransferase
LTTDARALVPRPETEELVMRVLRCAPLWSRREVAIADIGTGTGCIAIAIAAKKKFARVTAVDISRPALELARLNAEAAGVGDRIAFIEGDLFSAITPGSLDAVVSNPPYIARDVIATLDESVRRYEPLTALDGGVDGLHVIRPLIVQAFTALKNDGRVWLEIGDEQGGAVRGLMMSAGFRDVEIVRDMYGQVRFAEGIK